MNNVIVSKNRAIIKYLQETAGVNADVCGEVDDIFQIKNKHVYGALPLHLAIYSDSLTIVNMQDIPAEKRNDKNLINVLNEYKPRLITYRIDFVTYTDIV